MALAVTDVVIFHEDRNGGIGKFKLLALGSFSSKLFASLSVGFLSAFLNDSLAQLARTAPATNKSSKAVLGLAGSINTLCSWHEPNSIK